MTTIMIAGLAALLSQASPPTTAHDAMGNQPAPAAVTPVAPADATFNADTPVETLAANPAAKAILEKDVPSLLSHPSYDAIKGMSLRQIQPYSNGALTDAMIEAADKHLRALSAK